MKKNSGSDINDPNLEIKNEDDLSIDSASDIENAESPQKSKKGKKSSAKNNSFIDNPSDANQSTVEEPVFSMPEVSSIEAMPEEESEVNADAVKKAKKPWSKRKKIIVSSILGVLFLAVAAIGIYIVTLLNNPLSAFEDAAHQALNTPAQTDNAAAANPSDTPSASKGVYDDLITAADNSILKDTVNIMLIGVDHSVERDTEHWNFKDFHSDVMIVLSINKVTKEINMISLPRDTWAEIPGVKGIYKLNASIDCGGGWPTEGGFNKVCEAAEWMLGGSIAVDYYYAVDMNAVKGLVDAIGGVDYNIDLDFDIMGRSYTIGPMHMNGQAVLDYLRVRKGIDKDEAGDLNRIARQKRMLVAIFDKMRKTDLLAQLPNILKSFEGNLFYNTTLAQTAALAVFMKDIDINQITMNAMEGHYDNLFNWNFVFTDQKKRVELVKKIYGIDIKQESKYTHTSAQNKWAAMYSPVFSGKAGSLLTLAKAKLDADAALPEYIAPTDGTPIPAAIPSGFKQYGSDILALYDKANGELAALASQSGDTALNTMDQLKKDIESLCKKIGISIKENYFRYSWESDKSINAITVNFN